MSNKEFKTNNYIVGFIDILGSSEAIKRDVDGSLNIVHKAYEDSLDIFQQLFQNHYFQPSVKIFSDNIVLAVSYVEERFKSSAFLAVAMMSAIIQVEFLKKNWLIRGGISSGDFFADEVMVWGNALVKAYKMESMIAIYPRIVIEPELIGELKLALPEIYARIKMWIRQDKDNLFYIDYLNRCLKNADCFAFGLFGIVEKNIEKYMGNTKICQKWFWLNSYLNEKLPELREESCEAQETDN